ncbi:MAG: PcfJ domain-containing protein [Oscillospiraceae bacterium]|nr:PcfJ domain-containing protein [Oscillospiraceae bacterium]
MRVLKTKEAIIRAVPDLTQEDADEMNRQFTPYLFFKDCRDDGYRECWCSSCGEHFNYDIDQRIETLEHYEFIRAKHNEKTKCPHCGRILTAKETYRAKECLNLTEWKRLVFVKPQGKNTVFLVCAYAYKDYAGRDYLTEPRYSIATVYYITPQYVRQFKRAYDYTFLGLKDGQFYEPKSIHEPFVKTLDYNCAYPEKRGYRWIGFDRLKDTFLAYVPMDLFDEAYAAWWRETNSCYGYYSLRECPEVKFLAYYALYPNIEKLLKIDLGDFVCNLIDGRPMKRDIDWYAPTPKQMFGMRKDEFDDFRKNYYGMTDFRVYQILRKAKKGFTYSQAREIVEQYGYEASMRLAQAVKRRRLNLTHTLNYLAKNTNTKKCKTDYARQQAYQRTAIIWTDYIVFAAELKYDLKRDDVIFPKKLNEAHDNASAAVVAVRDQKAFEKYKARYEKLKKMYEYSDGKYMIVIPVGVNDIVEEGKVLSHCVGGYADRHMRGATTILFMRRCDEPNNRFITIEVRDSEKRICQKYGKGNRLLTQEENDFVTEWINWVKAGSKRNKKKKSAEKAA